MHQLFVSGRVCSRVIASRGYTNKLKTVINALNQAKFFSSCSQGSESSSEDTLPDPPTNCCMSGCSNCVWIDYAQSLVDHYKDGGAKARADIERLVTDPSLKMFIKLELVSKLTQEEGGK